MKNLANCKPSEFLRQTNRIRKAVETWLTQTDILNIRKRMPDLVKVTEDMSMETKMEIVESNKKKSEEQIQKNLMDMLDAILEQHPDETLVILGLLCFVEPEDVDNHPVTEYLKNFTELISNRDVLDFFISLVRLGQRSSASISSQ